MSSAISCDAHEQCSSAAATTLREFAPQQSVQTFHASRAANYGEPLRNSTANVSNVSLSAAYVLAVFERITEGDQNPFVIRVADLRSVNKL